MTATADTVMEQPKALLKATADAIAALHDVNLAASYCSHVLMLFGQGQWCAGSTQELLSKASLERLYGCAVEKLAGTEGPRFYPLPGT